MKVLYIAAECKPFSKSGGVGDVAGELPAALKMKGVDVEVVSPGYGQGFEDRTSSSLTLMFQGRLESAGIVPLRSDSVPVTLLTSRTYFGTDYSQGTRSEVPSRNPELFRQDYSRPYVNSPHIPFYDDALRFSFFSEACLEIIRRRQPDVVHINDWPLGYLFGRMVMEGMPQRRILTIHNIGYQGNVGRSSIAGWDIEHIAKSPSIGHYFADPRTAWNSVNPLRLGMELAHQVNTVSSRYKEEITQREDQSRYFEGGKGLEDVAARLDREGRLHGILNGFQYSSEATEDVFNATLARKAEAKRELSGAFASPDATLFGFVGRAVEQKFKLLAETVDQKSVLEHVLSLEGVNVAIVATGLPEYEKFLGRFVGRPNYSITIAFDRVKAAQISLGSDVLLMPSVFEPCGLTQLSSLRDATPPLVRWTGGLVDTVIPHTDPRGTGFGFDGRNSREVLSNLITTVRDALKMRTQASTAFRELQWRGFQKRFLWSTAADLYIRELYETG